MSFSELLLRALAGMRPLLPALIAVVLCTLAALVFLGLKSRAIWVDAPLFPLLGLFFGLNGKNVLRLACAWCKLLLTLVFLASFQKPTAVFYIAVLLPGILLAALSKGATQVLGSILWLLLQTGGLVCAGLVCGYYAEVSGSVGALLVYLAIALFTAVFGVYLFLLEINAISADRTVDIRATEEEQAL